MTTVRKLTERDFEEWHALRLRSLREDPEAFWSSFEEETDPGPLLQRFRDNEETGDGWILGAFSDGRMVGCAGFFRMHHLKRRHVGGIWGVYVAPEARGDRISQRIMDAAIERVRGMGGLERLELGVITGNAAAVKVYEACGFVTYGTQPAAIKIDGTEYDEFLMGLRLLDV